MEEMRLRLEKHDRVVNRVQPPPLNQMFQAPTQQFQGEVVDGAHK